MLNQQTNEATDVMNLNSDTNQDGLGIGQSSANINLDAGKKGKQFDWPGKIKQEDLERHTKPKENETDQSWKWEAMNEHYGNPNYKDHREEQKPNIDKPNVEKSTTQGEYEQTLQNLNNSLDMYQSLKDSLGQVPYGEFGKIILARELAKQLSNEEMKGIQSKLNLEPEEFKNYVSNYLNDKLIETRNSLNDIMNNENYDDRTPDQKREDEKQQSLEERQDNSYQRAVQDMLKAGINPASLQGGAVSGGGGSSGGSKSEEEEEKRKRKKREEETRRAAAEEQKRRQLMQVLGIIGGMGTMFGTTAMRNVGMRDTANIRAQGQKDVQNLRSQDNQLNNIWRQQMNDKNLDYKYNTIKYKTYDKNRKTYNEYYNYKD